MPKQSTPCNSGVASVCAMQLLPYHRMLTFPMIILARPKGCPDCDGQDPTDATSALASFSPDTQRHFAKSSPTS